MDLKTRGVEFSHRENSSRNVSRMCSWLSVTITVQRCSARSLAHVLATAFVSGALYSKSAATTTSHSGKGDSSSKRSTGGRWGDFQGAVYNHGEYEVQCPRDATHYPHVVCRHYQQHLPLQPHSKNPVLTSSPCASAAPAINRSVSSSLSVAIALAPNEAAASETRPVPAPSSSR